MNMAGNGFCGELVGKEPTEARITDIQRGCKSKSSFIDHES